MMKHIHVDKIKQDRYLHTLSTVAHDILRRVMLLVAVLVVLPCGTAHAFDLTAYADTSALASGRWVRISVGQEGGMQFVSYSDLRKWGFASPERVSVAGYGTLTDVDHLSEASYIDDLPQVPAMHAGGGIYFYASPASRRVVDDAGHVLSVVNPYVVRPCYFLTDSRTPVEPASEGIADGPAQPLTEFVSSVRHETDMVSYGQSGRELVGEDFRLTPSRVFRLDLPGHVDGTEAWVRVRFASRTSAQSAVVLTAAGQRLDADGALPAVTGNNYGSLTDIEAVVTPADGRIDLGITFVGMGTVYSANLDRIDVNYRRHISIASEPIVFTSGRPSVRLDGATSATRVWDVTDPVHPVALNVAVDTDGAVWTNPFMGERTYVAWNAGVSLPSPEFEAVVASQNLHSAAVAPDMVIIAPRELLAAARRLAELHVRYDSLVTLVVDQEHVFNEFASGTAHPAAFRHYLKMLYDRGKASGHNLKYALMMGRGSFDNRRLTASVSSLRQPLMPIWQSAESMSELGSYTTDDCLAQLEDNAGLRPDSDPYSIAVGRITARSAAEASAYVDKLERYMQPSAHGAWASRAVMLADDGDDASHMRQSEEQIQAFMSTCPGDALLYERVYLDAYPLVGGVCKEGRTRLHRLIDDGAVWWNYIGHANKYYLSGQGVMTLNDITSLRNRRWPVFFGATCYFMQWDGIDQSGSEKLLFNSSGGVIAAITATRPVFISENAKLSKAIGQEALTLDAGGRPVAIGESLRRAKNRLAAPASESNSNKLRYALLGDPALRPAVAPSRVVLHEVDGRRVDGSEADDIVMMARSQVKLTGEITDGYGRRDEAFNGRVSLELYDAERSVTTIGRDVDGSHGRRYTYEDHGSKIFEGVDTVIGGRWAMTVSMPSEIADNYRPATMVFSATSAASGASGCERGVYVYGMDDSQPVDTVPPVIESIYLNHPDFTDGGVVDQSPMLIARISDNVGINLSTAGIGHTMTIRIDGRESFNDVASYYTPATGERAAGTINYPLTALEEGTHTLEFRVYDTSGNEAVTTLTFNVDSQLAPEIFDIYTDVNPATVQANFYLSHNRPDAVLGITVSVYSMSGILVWSTTVTDRSDMFTSAPVTWNLTDRSGRRVPRGIYIYRAEVVSGAARAVSPARRLAVTGR